MTSAMSRLCNCDLAGTEPDICDKVTGECLCGPTYNGDQCEQCARGYYAYPSCMPCGCQEPGSTSNICEDRNGQCTCRGNYAGQNCERCAPGFYRYPDCVPCKCDQYGSRGASCDQETGQCDCFSNFQGLMCERCKEGLYNFPNCEECNCNPDGARQVPGYPLGGCGEVNIGRLCECKERVVGRICDMCKQRFWNLNRNNPLGCEECGCSPVGTIASMNRCDMGTGQCVCKVSVTGRVCDRCREGYYSLDRENLFGCQECKCDIGGSASTICNRVTGQCPCKPRVQGQRCDQPLQQHFIPSLDQFKYEIEDGYVPEGYGVRYGHDERIFPNFSWRGYATMSRLQPEVWVDIKINKPSLYRLLFHYVNLNEQSVNGEIILNPKSPRETQQTSDIAFAPSQQPAFTDAGNLGGLNNFVLNPGEWTVQIKTENSIFLDYMILIPQAYYEATILQNTVFRPCLTPNDEGPCYHYAYPDVLDFPRVLGEDGYIWSGEDKLPVRLFAEVEILNELDVDTMAILDPSQDSFNLDLNIPKKDRYVLVLNYYSQGNGTQSVGFNISTTGDQAAAILYKCQYSSLCRQVLLGYDEMEAIFDFEEGVIHIGVLGDENVYAAIESIVAIPYSVWSMGYIRPSIVCIRINGECVQSRYATPVGSVRIDFEELPNDHLITDVYPPGVSDTDIGLIQLNRTQNLIVLLGQARNPGPNKFIVHYYLPYSDGQEIQITMFANGQEYKGTFTPRFCPSEQGCRDVIFFDETAYTGVLNLQDTNVKIVFNNTSGQQIWLDYLLIIPSEKYSPTDILILPVDNSRNFIDTCLDEGYKIRTPISDFCEKSLFSLTTEFNNGALECECDIDGSLSFQCDANGGQCPCRPNVIGRTCFTCRVGYYGFPRCQPCNCPFGLCEQLTGQCICPPRVTGEKCDVCEPETYGYDTLIGCQECQCNSNGVMDGDMNCEQDSGQCRCRPGIGGRKCDYCIAGFYSFPYCQECDCDYDGTMDEICDPANGACICKDNVIGPRCDTCGLNTYNLEPTNPLGCSSCFCFGNTANCRESDLYWEPHMDMLGWGVTNTLDGEVYESRTTIAVLEALDKIDQTNMSMYWMAPESYLGNKVLSYGGFLQYTLIFVLPRNETIATEALIEPDLVLVGNHGDRVEHTAVIQPYDSSSTQMSVQLYEYNFRYPDGKPVDREAFMMILENLGAMHIRGSYYSLVDEIRLMEVELDVASENGTGERAKSVEQCQCPRGYSGASCEDCADGYYRARNYPFLGTCVPCDCNGHADSCDLSTGVCIDCHDNTMGDHCEQCLPGYYDDPYRSGCSICGCPLQVDSNNFADQCRVSSDNILQRCECFDGYTGDRCERCGPGHYGNPMTIGETCELCQCSGNIDRRDPYSCDHLTGECLRCENNSTGPQCERCEDWWYGDAILAKDCAECSCDQCGALLCGSQNGECSCKPNVIGMNCDQCAPDTWGFSECNGCVPCGCEEAAITSQCDLDNGTCSCQPGVRGDRCQACIPGHWNYGSWGCDMCDCEFDGAVTCDPIDGRCQCLPGVTGSKCEHCLDRWVLIPQEGCQECDTCIDNLLDDLEVLEVDVESVKGGLETVSIGQEAMKRLDRANASIFTLQPQVNSVLYESENITLEPVSLELQQMDLYSNTIRTRSEAAIADAEDLVDEGRLLYESTDGAMNLGVESEKAAAAAISYINGVLQQINEGIKVTNIETYITLSERIIGELEARNFTGQNDTLASDIEEAEMLLEGVKALQLTPQNQATFRDTVSDDIDEVNRRLLDLQVNSEDSEATTTKAKSILAELILNTNPKIEMSVDEILLGEDLTQESLEESMQQLNDSQNNLDMAAEELQNLSRVSSMLMQGRAALKQFTDIYSDLDQSEIYVNQTADHADMLNEQAAILETVYTDTRAIASNAVAAGRAYENIVKAINDASDAANVTFDNADSAAVDSNGVGELSKNFTMSSEELLIEAKLRFNATQVDLLDRLDSAKAGTMVVEGLNKEVSIAGNQIKQRLLTIPVGEVGQKANDVSANGEAAGQRAEDAKVKVKDILKDLPKQLEKTVPLTNDALNTKRDIVQARAQVNTVQKFIPNIQTLLTDLTAESERVMVLGQQVKTNIAALKEKIAIARNQANLIRVGLNFLGNTTVELRNPRNVAQAGSYSDVSLFFKTTDENGLLLYAGSEMSGSKKPNQDFMSIEIENGNAVFKYNLDSGLVKINHPHYVSDGQWYKVTAKRIGKAGTLLLEQDQNKPELPPVMGVARGSNTVLDLHPLTTKFYSGGLPEEATMISEDVTRDTYVGIIEDIKFDDNPMGVWNFKEGNNNYKGARERDILTSVVSNGFRFDGAGFVILSTSQTGWKPAVKSQVSMKFKTYAPNGLLFFAGEDRDFISIELRDGKVLHQYDLGGGRVQLEYKFKEVNDGEWHDVQINRRNKTGMLFVDGEGIGPVDSPGSLTQLAITDEISIGGYSGIILPVSDVTKLGFDGCIEDVALQLGTWDLNENTQAKGVSPGCPAQILRVATYEDQQLSFIANPIESIGENFDLTFKMKSKQEEALLIFAANDDQSVGFSVSLVQGKISVVSNPGNERLEITSRVNTYNDGRWHYISIMKKGISLEMNIDDYETVRTRGTDGFTSVDTTSPLYFGNADINVPTELANSQEQFGGCIGDVTINGQFLNFAVLQPTQRPNIALAGCPIPDPEGPYNRDPLPTLYPPTEPPSTTEAPTMPPGQCALTPVEPQELPEESRKGFYFGAYPGSRLEYESLPSLLRIRGVITLDFKTSAENGVLLYFADTKHIDFISITLQNGMLRFAFDCGSGSGEIISEGKVNDGKWHSVTAARNFKEGALQVDGIEVGIMSSGGRSRSLNVKAPYYIGGVNTSLVIDKGLKNLNSITTDYVGCIANIQISGEDMGAAQEPKGVLPCPDEMASGYTAEIGAYFYGDGGYVKLVDAFQVKRNFELSIEIRPRSFDGVIFSVHGDKGDFVVLQLVDGELWFTADNGAGSIIAKIQPEMNNKFCNGAWHSVIATKRRNVVTLSVDGADPVTATSSGTATSADTNNPIYLGGKPDTIMKGIRAQDDYMGCMRNLYINGESQFLATGVAFGDVSLTSCPAA
ncbi:laminin subunit alpha-like [Mya arenaria]|uniref:laminin subunit alpha-like n=1 Tax=Mya arenaria TaxID=6604 RepID=UPI0022E8DF1B|nr:laminin subunit alpha-like [Mya arenaria]